MFILKGENKNTIQIIMKVNSVRCRSRGGKSFARRPRPLIHGRQPNFNHARTTARQRIFLSSNVAMFQIVIDLVSINCLVQHICTIFLKKNVFLLRYKWWLICYINFHTANIVETHDTILQCTLYRLKDLIFNVFVKKVYLSTHYYFIFFS